MPGYRVGSAHSALRIKPYSLDGLKSSTGRMAPEPRITMVQEYGTLRDEILEAKRYVFERPLAIAVLAAAGLQFLDKPPALILPPLVAALTVFNLRFTVNRLQSAGRIVAYIQLVLEPSATIPWVGWETSLRRYRRWLKANPDASAFVDARLDHAAVPDALMYYPALYNFHFVLISSASLAAIALLIQYQSSWRLGSFASTVGLACWSIKYFRRWRPSRLRGSIERNRVIWQNVLEEDLIDSWRQTR